MEKSEVIKKALELGFKDIGFTTMEPFESQREILDSRKDEYAWALKTGIDLIKGLDPKNVLHDGKYIIDLIGISNTAVLSGSDHSSSKNSSGNLFLR